MKASVVTLLLTGLVAAQDFSGQPDCAIPCLKDAIPKAGCALTDTACQCKTSTQAQLVGLVAPCLIEKCSASDLAKAQSAAAAACKDEAAGSSSDASSAASSAATSAAGSTAPASTSAAATSEATTSAAQTTSAADSSAAQTSAADSSAPASTAASGGASIPTSSPTGGVSNSTVSGSRSVVTRTSTAFVGGGGGSQTSAPKTTSLNGAAGPVAGVLGAVVAALMAL
ncbi:hypothetical protein HDV63DRAFT_373738 [Trichoderma sp. SZMC 28014]